MQATLNPQPSTINTVPSTLGRRLKTWLPIGLFCILWADLIRQLSYTWQTNEQYAYGWFVPILALALLWKRWMSRPAPCSQPSTLNPQPSSNPQPPSWSVALVVMTALLLLPLRVVHEINQDWPLMSWPLALCVVGLTLYAVYLAGGRSWLKHFAFPVCFILAAVQWPYRIEHSLTQGLMRLDTNMTVEILGWFNVPAMQRGNLIELATGTVGIDEACSGIRSFQSTLMAALFLGELYRLRIWTRAGLVIGGLGLAFGFNVIRTLILTVQANKEGLSAIDKWHDPAGFTITIACFFVLWGIAVFLLRKTKAADNPQPSTLNPQPATPRRYLIAVGCWAVFCLIANEVWYRSHQLNQSATARWWVNFPTSAAAFTPVSVSASARKLLKYDEGVCASWDDPDGTKWYAYSFRWRAGDPTARMSAQGHRPEYCMTGSGHQMNAELGTRYIQANGLNFPFRAYIFDAPASPVYVFFCLWEDGAEKQVGFGKTKYADRLRTVLAGRRGMGQQTLEIIVSGYSGIADAEDAVRKRLPGIIKVSR